MSAAPSPPPAGPTTILRPAPTPRWLSHHHDDQLDRCLVLRGRHVCRRCAVLYPLALVTMVGLLLGGVAVGPVLLTLLWLLPLPTVLEWVLEHAGRIRHSPARLVALTALAAPALGIALAAHARSPFTLAATLPIAVYAAVCLGSAALAAFRRAAVATPDWETRHEAAEQARHRELVELLALPDESPSERAADR
jgi:hypothetical protein